jgi:hypothetical protein
MEMNMIQYVVYRDNKTEMARFDNLPDALAEEQRLTETDEYGLAWYETRAELKDFLRRSQKIVNSLRGYGQAFGYAALYEDRKTLILQGNYLIERLEEILPELKMMIKYLEDKEKK